MARIQQSIEVNGPVHTVYNQLTQFEDYPRFMENVVEVRQTDDTHLHWHTKLSGQDLEWDSEITEQVPDKLIAWRNADGPVKAGRVELQSEGEERTRVTLVMEYDPQQQRGDSEAQVAYRVQQDLVRLKKFLESRQSETGAWRGEVHQGQVTKPPQQGDATQAGQSAHFGYAAGSEGEDGNEDPGVAVGTVPPKGGRQQGSGQAPGSQQERSTQTPSSLSQASADDAMAQSMKPPHQRWDASAREQGAPSRQQVQPSPELSWFPSLLHAWQEPLIMMRRMTEEMDHIFERFAGPPGYGASARQADMSAANAWVPLLEIEQRENELVISADLPGVKLADVRVEIRNSRLIIEGDRREQAHSSEQGLRCSERPYGHFYRVITLPDGVDADAASASMQDGILSVTVPVQHGTQQGKRLDIRSPR